MFNMKIGPVLLFLILILFSVGCQPTQVTKTTPTLEAKAVEKGLHIAMRTTPGFSADVYLIATDERIRKENAFSCYANQGDTIRSGTYSFYLQTDPTQKPIKQEISPFGQTILEFNEERPQMLQLLSAPNQTGADLLAIHQPSGCNGDEVAILALSPDAKSLVQLSFQTPTETKATLFASKIQRMTATTLKTIAYDNATSRYSTIVWKIDFNQAQLIAVDAQNSTSMK